MTATNTNQPLTAAELRTVFGAQDEAKAKQEFAEECAKRKPGGDWRDLVDEPEAQGKALGESCRQYSTAAAARAANDEAPVETIQPEDLVLVESVELQEYTRLQALMDAFKAKHADIFIKFRALENQIKDADAALRAAAKARGSDEDNGIWRVRLQESYTTTYDPEILLQRAPFLATTPGVIKVVKQVDGRKIEGMVKLKMLDEAIVLEAQQKTLKSVAAYIEPCNGNLIERSR